MTSPRVEGFSKKARPEASIVTGIKRAEWTSGLFSMQELMPYAKMEFCLRALEKSFQFRGARASLIAL